MTALGTQQIQCRVRPPANSSRPRSWPRADARTEGLGTQRSTTTSTGTRAESETRKTLIREQNVAWTRVLITDHADRAAIQAVPATVVTGLAVGATDAQKMNTADGTIMNIALAEGVEQSVITLAFAHD